MVADLSCAEKSKSFSFYEQPLKGPRLEPKSGAVRFNETVIVCEFTPVQTDGLSPKELYALKKLIRANKDAARQDKHNYVSIPSDPDWVFL